MRYHKTVVILVLASVVGACGLGQREDEGESAKGGSRYCYEAVDQSQFVFHVGYSGVSRQGSFSRGRFTFEGHESNYDISDNIDVIEEQAERFFTVELEDARLRKAVSDHFGLSNGFVIGFSPGSMKSSGDLFGIMPGALIPSSLAIRDGERRIRVLEHTSEDQAYDRGICRQFNTIDQDIEKGIIKLDGMSPADTLETERE